MTKEERAIFREFLSDLHAEVGYKTVIVSPMMLGGLDSSTGEGVFCEVSGLRLEFENQGIYYDSDEKEFFYYGECRNEFGVHERRLFVLTDNTLERLSGHLKNALCEAATTKKAVPFTFHPRNPKTGKL